MKDRTHSQQNKKDQAGKVQNHTSQPPVQFEELPEAVQRVKNMDYPTMKTGDVLNIQQGIGNKAAGNLVAQRLFGKQPNTVQRHQIPEGRQAVGEEDDEIQKMPYDGSIQRHQIPDNRQAVGEEDDQIQTSVQRSPAFGRDGQPVLQRQHNLWGNGKLASVQRQKAKGKEKGIGGLAASILKSLPKTSVKEDPATVKQAQGDFGKFVGGGPFKIAPYVPDQVDDFGKFDTTYDPTARTLTADMRVKFTFPDMPVPTADKTIVDKAAQVGVKLLHATYITNFIGQVHKGWSGRFSFKNVREPQSVWGKLNPITVKVNVQPVETGQHYLIKGYLNKTGTANVSSNTPGAGNPSPSTLELYKGDLDSSTQSFTGSKKTAPHEVKRLMRNLPKIHFANSSMAIESKYLPDLQYVADYLRQMNRPKFTIMVLGHASQSGPESDNFKFSQRRADVVKEKFRGFGVSNHNFVSIGMGSLGADKSGSWRKVDFFIVADPAFKNVQDTTVHEFGHMMGLDDEYVRKGDTRTHTTQKAFMAKMLGTKAYGKGKEGKLGDEVTSVLPMSSASVMESGNEVRPYHYVTLWQALYDTAAKSAAQPLPPFTWKDWKVNM